MNLKIMNTLYKYTIGIIMAICCYQPTFGDSHPVIEAIVSRDTETINPIINDDSDPNTITLHYSENESPLHLAVKELNVKAVALLIKHKANVHALDVFNNTPLSVAIDQYSKNPAKATEIVQHLLDAGADPLAGYYLPCLPKHLPYPADYLQCPADYLPWPSDYLPWPTAEPCFYRMAMKTPLENAIDSKNTALAELFINSIISEKVVDPYREHPLYYRLEAGMKSLNKILSCMQADPNTWGPLTNKILEMLKEHQNQILLKDILCYGKIAIEVGVGTIDAFVIASYINNNIDIGIAWVLALLVLNLPLLLNLPLYH